MQNAQTEGYLSPEHKKTFTLAGGILGGVSFLAQFAVPFIIMLVAMPSMMFSGAMSVREAHPSHGVYWQGKLLYPEAEVSFYKTKKSSASHLTALSLSQLPVTDNRYTL